MATSDSKTRCSYEDMTLSLFQFLRERSSSTYPQYGPYVYRHVISKQLVASWNSPKEGKYMYSGEAIGMNVDAAYIRMRKLSADRNMPK